MAWSPNSQGAPQSESRIEAHSEDPWVCLWKEISASYGGGWAKGLNLHVEEADGMLMGGRGLEEGEQVSSGSY